MRSLGVVMEGGGEAPAGQQVPEELMDDEQQLVRHTSRLGRFARLCTSCTVCLQVILQPIPVNYCSD